MGYYDGQEVKACAQAGIKAYVPKPITSANRSLGLFTKEDFRYDTRRDRYRCPAGQYLTFRFQTRELDRDVRYYATPACAGCRLRAKCTRNAGGRRITRSVDEVFLEAMERRVRAHPEKFKRRKGMVEHPFGTIKRSMNQGYFLTQRPQERGNRNEPLGTRLRSPPGDQHPRCPQNDQGHRLRALPLLLLSPTALYEPISHTPTRVVRRRSGSSTAGPRTATSLRCLRALSSAMRRIGH